MTILSTPTLDGNNVRSVKGGDLGYIRDIMIDVSNNSIAYYIFSFEELSTRTGKLFALPAQSLTLDTKNKCFVLKATIEKLENAEGFDEDHWPNFTNKYFRLCINNYYGRRSFF